MSVQIFDAWPKTSSPFAIALCAVVFALPSESFAARVGYRFEGAFLNSSNPLELFGRSVSGDARIVGTFSYDVPVPGVDAEPGIRNFPQAVWGGLSLMISDEISEVWLSASEFVIAVGNDFEFDPPDQVDLFGISFERSGTSTNPVLFVNENPWSGAAVFAIELTWPPETFIEPDEPKLTTTRPITPDFSGIGFVGNTAIIHTFLITSISAIEPVPGDYNRNGVVDSHDYIEWKRAFGGSDEGYSYADGNSNQVVDAADYVVWRQNLNGAPPAHVEAESVPEPISSSLITPLVVFCMTQRVFRGFRSWATS
jgi:hypothetical protein